MDIIYIYHLNFPVKDILYEASGMDSNDKMDLLSLKLNLLTLCKEGQKQCIYLSPKYTFLIVHKSWQKIEKQEQKDALIIMKSLDGWIIANFLYLILQTVIS